MRPLSVRAAQRRRRRPRLVANSHTFALHVPRSQDRAHGTLQAEGSHEGAPIAWYVAERSVEGQDELPEIRGQFRYHVCVHTPDAQILHTLTRVMFAKELLAGAVAFRDAPLRTEQLPTSFASTDEAVHVWRAVLLHEAHEDLDRPLTVRPTNPYLHPVDVDTDEPGIVTDPQGHTIARVARRDVPRVTYEQQKPSQPPQEEQADGAFAVTTRTAAVAARHAQRSMQGAVRRAEGKAQTLERQEERRRARAEETAEEREVRCQTERERRRVRTPKAAEPEKSPTPKPPKPKPPCPSYPDVSMMSTVVRRSQPVCPRTRLFSHPVPHHRHLTGLQTCGPHPALHPALCEGVACDGVRVIQGPPGTGKTTALVEALASTDASARVFACAPTNVGAANLYERLVASGYAADASLVLPRERVPPGTVVRSNDPGRRIVCATVTARHGRLLHEVPFEVVLLDEAGQCMEAWVWTLLRPDVTCLVMAGDVHQLPPLTSETGRTLHHDRSLMARLVLDLSYPNTRTLHVQHRMAPELARLANEAFYDGRLVQGARAPKGPGCVRLVHCADGREEREDTSFWNGAEVDHVEATIRESAFDDVIVLCPYAAQCRKILARGTSVPVHTIDSFQGREARVVVLSLVRDGHHGLGFWSDYRRAVVALTRARETLVVVYSGSPEAWSDSPIGRALGMR
jgi:hypothetical protein